MLPAPPSALPAPPAQLLLLPPPPLASSSESHGQSRDNSVDSGEERNDGLMGARKAVAGIGVAVLLLRLWLGDGL